MKKFTCILVLTCSFLAAMAQNSNVGIGTTSPQASALLDLTSTSKGFLPPRMSNAQRNAIVSPINGLIIYQTNTVGTETPGLYIYTSSAWKRLARAEEITGGGTGSWTVTGTDQYSNVSGNVGIGLSSGINHKFMLKGNALITHVNPNDLVNGGNQAVLRMHAAGTGSARVEFLSSDSTAQASVSYTSVGNVLNIRHLEGPYQMRFYESGKVGIGTGILNDTAHATLHIKEGLPVNLTTQHGHLMLGAKAGTNIAIGDYEILARNNGATSPLYLQQDGGAVRIGSTGTTADTRLHITNGNNSTLSTHGYFVMGTVTGENITMDQNSIQARMNGAADILSVQNYGGDFRVHTNSLVVAGTSQFTGLGTASPAERLHVVGNALLNSTNPNIQLQNGGVDKGFVQLSGDNIRIGTNSANDAGKFVVRTNSGDRVFVDGAGNMGIGIASPQARLDVAGGGIRVVRNGEALTIDGVNPYMQFWQNGVGKFYMQQSSNNLLIASSSGNTTGDLLMFADEVGINTSDPAEGYSLSVGGEIMCEELRVELSSAWPDYVFGENYALTPLSELKAFIQEHKHLPNIPAAAEVESEGFDVGDMNRRLLEKVEELTLHIIRQQEEIDALKKQMQK